MIARDRIDLLAPMVLERTELPHHLAALRIVRQIPKAGIVAEIERDIPAERRAAKVAAFLGLPKR